MWAVGTRMWARREGREGPWGDEANANIEAMNNEGVTAVMQTAPQPPITATQVFGLMF